MAVVLIHCFTTVLDNASVAEVGVGRALGWTECIVVLARWAVPAFLMVTGALLLDPGREVGWGKIRGYIARIAAVLLSFGALFALAETVFDARTFDISMVPEAFLAVLQGRSWAHLWYLYDLIGVYLLLPLLRAFVSRASGGEYRAMLSVLFVCSLAVPTINAAVGLSVEGFVWVGSSVFYVLLGWYLHAFPVSLDTRAVCLGAFGLAVQVGVAWLGIAGRSLYPSWIWVPDSPFVAIYAAAVFLAFKRFARVPMPDGSPQRAIARCSFAIYVVHPVFLHLIYKVFDWASAPLPPVAFETVTFVGVFAVSFGAAFLVCLLPILRKVF